MMAPRKKQDALLPSTDKELKDTLWKAADKLRGSMDASQYKDVVLGRYLLAGPAPGRTDGLRHGQPAVQHQGLEPGGVGQPLDLRRTTG